MSRRRVLSHKRVWELHTSAAMTHSLLFSVASTTNLVGHDMFRACLDLFRPGWNGWNGSRLFVVVCSIPSCLCPFLISRQPSNRPEQKLTQLTFAAGPCSSTRRRVPSRRQRVLLTQRMNFHANILQGKPQSRRCEPSKSHLRGKSRGYDIAIAARRRLLSFL